ELYREDGAHSMIDWLLFRFGWSRRFAREHVELAHSIAALPRLKKALPEGAICWEKAVLIAKIATPQNEEVWVRDAEIYLYPRLERLVQMARRIERDEMERKFRERFVQIWHDHDGFVRIRGRLPEADGAVLVKALDRIKESMGPDRPDGTYNHP